MEFIKSDANSESEEELAEIMEGEERDIAYLLVEEGHLVRDGNGEEAGKVTEILADPASDIFSGLVVSLHSAKGQLQLHADDVKRITNRALYLTLSNAELKDRLSKDLG